MAESTTRRLGADDESPHAPQGAGEWRETWSLAFFDHSRRIRGTARARVQPLAGKAFALFAVFRDDRPLFVIDTDTLGSRDFDHAGAVVGPLRFACDEPMRRWTVSVEARAVSARLEWSALGDAYEWNWHEAAGSRHYEQPGRVSGVVTIDGEAYPVEGLAQRERGWGELPLAAIRSAWSSRVFFAEGEMQHAAVVHLRDTTHMFGYRMKDGRSRLIDRLRLSPSFAYPGGPPISTELMAWCADELVADQQVRLANVVPRLRVANRIETHQFFTFSEWFEGATSHIGQLDYAWSSQRPADQVLDVSGNNGMWCG